MALCAALQKKILQFKFDARTSRGSMQQHVVYYLKIWDNLEPEIIGVGECAPLPGLSPEYGPEYETWLYNWVKQFNNLSLEIETLPVAEIIRKYDLVNWPSVRFGLETAMLDLQNKGQRKLFSNSFSHSEAGIPINGLIWMGDREFMQQQIEKKLQEGYSCLKLKIGGLDFTTELMLLQQIREVASASNLTIRLDANGAFRPEDALQKLEQLAAFTIHSIEQPIKPKQPELMAYLCSQSPIPIALDEELIGIVDKKEKQQLLSTIRPAYIILKPSLVGGFAATQEWINLAEAQGMDWWMTSALESNIGLNAISQFTAEFEVKREQGLGTGQLYQNNILSPLQIQSGKLYYDSTKVWGNLD
ncbi:o-succinylbenzoate synthase [Adhaeribacter radiodurans]|uniref:O-succinylbenzoate synthase n=1 Tax=Adhaeribacter radiodurans TaxID=2745197 RepID=A0A7L7L6N3_9BACT|nr:o-succinylbenzoate synthase [Adhaeribacter radiodurans]QMU28496.1 o-succinylbenzoate synthase [Adhaeribacter radiodurans]